VPPDKEWWRELNLGSPEAIIKVFVQQSGCFSMVNRDRAMQSRAMERALAEQGELQKGSRMGAVSFRLQAFHIPLGVAMMITEHHPVGEAHPPGLKPVKELLGTCDPAEGQHRRIHSRNLHLPPQPPQRSASCRSCRSGSS